MTEREQLEKAIEALEAQRATLGDAVVAAAVGPMRRDLAQLDLAESEPSSPLGGERKLVTIMFADISGFTALAEMMDPETVRDLMNACFEWLVPIVGRFGGTVDKFIGDAIMALFGAPASHENDAERALRAALEMRDALTEFNVHRQTELGLHFGINTGLVVAGDIGTRGRQEYSVMGDSVNLASRLGDASERGEIFVGPDTYHLAASLFEFEKPEPVMVKGKIDPILVYRLLSVKDAPGEVRGIRGLTSTLIGRDKEIRQLRGAVETLGRGKGCIAAILGEPGLGKSRLVVEARQMASEKIAWVEGRALSHSEERGYWLAREVLRGLVGVRSGASPADAGAAMQISLERVLRLLDV